MLAKRRARLTYANAMSTLALFVALGGSSYAAITLSKNSVKSKHIAKGQVKRSDVAKSAVNSARVKDFSLRSRDFKRGQLPAGARGAAGPQGPPGPTFADVGGSYNPPPSPHQTSPSVPAFSYSFATPAAGRALVEMRTRVSVTCTIGVGLLGIYVDGERLLHSGRLVGGTAEERSFAGLTAVLAPGQHTAVLLATCPDGNFTSTSGNEAIWSALLIAG